MRRINYTVTDYCSLFVDSTNWDGAMIPVLVELFRSVIEEFNSLTGVEPNRQLLIQPDNGWGYPMCSKYNSVYYIFLSARQNYWSKYVYQFAHEYCHYLIDGPLDGELETTFWFEESICELASMVILREVTSRWLSWSPVYKPQGPLSERDQALFSLKGFARNNEPYLHQLLLKNPSIDIPLYEWLDKKMSILSEPVYHRDMYNQIASSLYELFIIFPNLWKVIPFLRRPVKEDYMGFRHFITTTLKSRVNIHIEHLSLLTERLIGSIY